MTKNEKKLESKILDLDCYDQELWVVDIEILPTVSDLRTGAI